MTATNKTWDNKQDDDVTKMVQEIYETLPKSLEYQKCNNADDNDKNSLDLILKQETLLYNQVIDVMQSTLADVLDSLNGMF